MTIDVVKVERGIAMRTISKMLLLIALCLSITATALAAPGDATLLDGSETGSYEYVQSMAVWDGALYMITSKGLYRYEAQADAPERLGALSSDANPSGDAAAANAEEPAQADASDDSDSDALSLTGTTISGSSLGSALTLIAGEDALYLLNGETGELFRLSWADGKMSAKSVVTLDWSDMLMHMQSYDMPRAGNRAVLDGNHLYLTRMEDDYISHKLMRFDVETGKGERVSEETVISFSQYKESQLVAIIRKGFDQPLQISTIDKASGAVASLLEAKGEYDFGLQYDGGTDTIYFMSSGQLYASKGGAAAEVVAYFPTDSVWESMPSALIDGGYYALSNSEKVIVRNVDPAYKQNRALKINGLYSDEVSRAFMNDHPEIPLVLSTQHFEGAEALTANMLSGDMASDIYTLYLAYSQYEALVEKGYVVDLSSSEALKAEIAKMYPEIAEILQKDGKLYAFPQYFSAFGMGYSPKVLEKIGLTEDDVPKTYTEFLAFVDRWESEFAAEYPELTLFDSPEEMDLRSQIFSSVFQDYALHCQRTGEELKFDTELFTRLLRTIETTDFSGFKQPDPDASEEGGGSFAVMVSTVGEDEGPTALFQTYKNVTMTGFRYDDGYKLMPLALDDGLTPVLNAELSLFIVNPNSENADLAMQFLEYYAQNLPAAMKANMMPGENEAVLNPSYGEMMQEAEKLVEEMRAAYEAAKGTENEKAMELELQNAEQSLEFRKQFEWSVTEEDISAYRAIYDMLVINKGNVFYDGGGEQTQELATLVQRYLDKQIEPEQMVKELDKKIRMMMMEGN